MDSVIDEIKNRLDIVEVIGSYIKLQKAGANYRAVCPFHSEKKPSFFVSPARQIWHCFGCQKGGDIFAFVKEIEGVEFGDALRILAQRAGVELQRHTPEYSQLKTERQRLYEICELATRFFEKQLEESSAGKEAKKYLLRRGISEDSIKKWRLGYAPEKWQGLSDFLAGKGYKKEEIVKTGLAIQKEEPGLQIYDRFRGRIIFPVFDLDSNVIGFGGRVFKEKDKEEVAKYINTPNTLLYDKSRILYGLDKAKVEIRKKDSCILLEGYTDVIMASQAGTQNVVATSGTALTPYQLKIIKRYSENLILGFDMDLAGDTATKRGIDLAQNFGFNIKVTRLPEGKDAADVIAKNPKEWFSAVENAVSILDFYFQLAFSNHDPKKSEGKKEISKILLPVIKRIPNQIEKSFWVQRLAKELEVKEEAVEEEMKKTKCDEETCGMAAEDADLPAAMQSSPQKSRKELLEERLMVLLLKSSKNISLIDKSKLAYFSPQIQEILVKLADNKKIESDFFNYLSLKSDIEQVEEKEILPEIQYCLREIQSLEIKNRLDKISREIKQSEAEKDFKKAEKLTQEFNQLAKSINTI